MRCPMSIIRHLPNTSKNIYIQRQCLILWDIWRRPMLILFVLRTLCLPSRCCAAELYPQPLILILKLFLQTEEKWILSNLLCLKLTEAKTILRELWNKDWEITETPDYFSAPQNRSQFFCEEDSLIPFIRVPPRATQTGVLSYFFLFSFVNSLTSQWELSLTNSCSNFNLYYHKGKDPH